MNQERRPNPAEVYQQYFVPGSFARWAPVLLERARAKRGERVLDVACGTGVVARQVAPMVGAEGRMVAVDPNPAMLEVARREPAPLGAAIEWQQRDACELPDGPFDLVLCQHGLQFCPDRRAAVEEMRRVLAPGGRVAISTWQGLEHQSVYQPLLEAAARRLETSVEALAGLPFSLDDPNELRALLEDAGFEQIEVAQVENTVSFPQPGRFVLLTVVSGAAVVPKLAEMDAPSRSALAEEVTRDIQSDLEPYIDGDTVSFPMHANIAVALA
ncbi:MAG TPA: methyltransferase domain-containing protein [Thermoanaerobaculia bacterium]|nr:methyltransferase domain-containing protein [Thermoanaerobaculia bacterium]